MFAVRGAADTIEVSISVSFASVVTMEAGAGVVLAKSAWTTAFSWAIGGGIASRVSF